MYLDEHILRRGVYWSYQIYDPIENINEAEIPVRIISDNNFEIDKKNLSNNEPEIEDQTEDKLEDMNIQRIR